MISQLQTRKWGINDIAKQQSLPKSPSSTTCEPSRPIQTEPFVHPPSYNHTASVDGTSSSAPMPSSSDHELASRRQCLLFFPFVFCRKNDGISVGYEVCRLPVVDSPKAIPSSLFFTFFLFSLKQSELAYMDDRRSPVYMMSAMLILPSFDLALLPPPPPPPPVGLLPVLSSPAPTLGGAALGPPTRSMEE